MISILIPANNEAGYIGACLDALLVQETARTVELIVAANACTDQTVAIAQGYAERFAQKHWRFEVLDIPQAGKPGALNRADAAASGGMRVYLDADVVMSPSLLEELAQVLDRDEPAYASGKMVVAPAQSWVTRAYGRIWTQLPFMTDGVPGAGLFAVNAAGRTRWGDFPDIISDDTFVRLQFAPEERIGVAASYDWPLVEGFAALVRVRRRQNAGVAEVARLWPEIMEREGKVPFTWPLLIRLAGGDPAGFAVYAAVSQATRCQRWDMGWVRGR